jgi:hypothetical protein
MCACKKIRGVSKKFVGSTVGQRFVWGTIQERVPQKTYEKTWMTPCLRNESLVAMVLFSSKW